MPTLTQWTSRLPLLRNWFRQAESPTTLVSKLPTVLSPKNPVLTGHGLTRTFGSGETKMYALKDVAIELHSGELNLLMGPSGSGKSTLLAVLSALLRPDAGQVKAFGRDVWAMNGREMEQFRLEHCSYIFQGYNLFPAFTARQQLEVVLQWGEGVSLRVARKRADHVLGQLGLTGRAHLRPAALSGGEKQRVAIARALVKNPSFIFADEPTSALDWDNGQSVMDLLKECATLRGATVLVVAHDHRLEAYADKIFRMADGMLAKPAGEATKRGEAPKAAGKGRVRIADLEFAHA